MGCLGCGFSLGAGFFLVLGLIPFLGWLNWITTLPLAAIATVLCYSAVQDRRNGAAPVARIGLVAAILILLLALLRLTAGGGLI